MLRESLMTLTLLISCIRGSANGRNGDRDRDRDRGGPRYGGRGRYGDREREHPSPAPCKVLGVFGLSTHTRERDLEDLFTEYAKIKNVTIVYDLKASTLNMTPLCGKA